MKSKSFSTHRLRFILLTITFSILLLTTLFLVPAPLSGNSSAPARSKGNSLAAGGSAPALTTPTPYLVFFPMIGAQPLRDLAFSSAHIIQGTTPSVPYAAYVAGRPTTLRALVSVSPDETIAGVMGRMYGFDAGGNLIGFVDSNTMSAPSLESDMARTLNFNLPFNWIQSGTSFVISLDPNNTLGEQNRNNNRYPPSGNAAFGFSSAAPLQVVIVPILYLPKGLSSSTLPPTGDLGYLEWMPGKVMPVPGVAYSLHTTISFEPGPTDSNLDEPSGAGWLALLNKVSDLHSAEDPTGTKVYYGVVDIVDAHGGCEGCYTGMGWIGDHSQLPTAVGWSGSPNGNADASETMTHEMGHNFGREHVLCQGSENYPDPAYPYAGGRIGTWGLDVATGTLYDPALYADYMSYCPSVWTSDYTFAGIRNYRNSGLLSIRQASAPVQAMYVSGTISPEGAVTLRPVYQQLATPSAHATGSHVLELLGDKDAVLASFAFTPTRVGDSRDYSGFGLFVPAMEGVTGVRIRQATRVLIEKSVSAVPLLTSPAGDALTATHDERGTHLRWSPVPHPTEPVLYRVRFSRDEGLTWQVLALDWRGVEFTVPLDIDLNKTRVEVQATDGLHVTTRTLDIHF